MHVGTVLEGSPRRPGRRNGPGSGKACFLVLAAGFGFVSALYLADLPATAMAAQDDGRVSITPIVRRPAEALRRSDAIHVDVNLVLIPVTVTDHYERPVKGLRKSDFHLFEDGSEREIAEFFTEESPISIGIVFDASGSMKSKMVQSAQAVKEFLKLTLPGDEFSLMKFSDRPEPVFGFTTDAKNIEDTLPSIQPAGWTALFDAVYLGIHQMKHATRTRKVLLVMSDGGDNNSRYTEKEIKSLVKEADVRIFSISILDRSPALESIALESGGRAYRVRKLDELPDLAAEISAELHSQYVLGFSPTDRTNDGQYRKIKVELVQPDATARLRASWKHGYYGPASAAP